MPAIFDGGSNAMATTSEKGKGKEQPIARNAPARGTGEVAPYRGDSTVATRGWQPLRQVREDFDRLFNQFFLGWPGMRSGMAMDRFWGLDVREKENEVEIRAEAPGFEPSDFDVQVRGTQLVLHAAHKNESRDDEDGYYEWSQNEFHQAVPLPTGVDADKVAARYRNGVLTVTVPKSEEAKARRITVQG